MSSNKDTSIVKNKLILIMMLKASNGEKFWEYKRSLQDSMSGGHNCYPTNKSTSYIELRSHMKGPPLVGRFLVNVLRFETYGPFT